MNAIQLATSALHAELTREHEYLDALLQEFDSGDFTGQDVINHLRRYVRQSKERHEMLKQNTTINKWYQSPRN